MAFAPAADAQFSWFFDQQPKAAAPKPRPKAKRPVDDLPPILPRESSVPPPPDDRPYDGKLMRLAEILGAVHYLRELCGAQEGQVWRDQMKEILRNEGTTAVRRAKLVNSFNDGYRGYRRTYRSCTQSATLATTRFSTEGASNAASLAQGSNFASKSSASADTNSGQGTATGANAEAAPAEAKNSAAAPAQAAPPATAAPAADTDQTGGVTSAPAGASPGPAPAAQTPAAQPPG
jgi:uncharacterized protein (TIGR02301 family)